MKLIIVVDDDPLWWQTLEAQLPVAFDGVELRWIRSEMEFRRAVPELNRRAPALILMDVMLPWCFPSEVMEPPPPDVEKGGFYSAGLRCQQILATNKQTKNVPVILYTVLEREALELLEPGSAITYIRKDAELEPLLDRIHAATGLARRPAPS